jgi:hypothetical protein
MKKFPKSLEAQLPNVNKKEKRVKYLSLRHILGEDSHYRRACPVCKNGLLLVARDMVTFELLDRDRCISCGQAVIYTDAEKAFGEENAMLKVIAKK